MSSWATKKIAAMPVAHCGREVPVTKSYIFLTPRLANAISGDATNICGVGGKRNSINLWKGGLVGNRG